MKNVMMALVVLAAAMPAAAQTVHSTQWTPQQLQALQTAQDYLDQHRADFGLGPTDAPRPKMVTLQDDSMVGGTIARIVYEPQSYKGLLVEGTRIDVVIETFNSPKLPTHVSAGGRWAPGLSLSDQPTLTSDQAGQKIVGTQLGSWGVPPFTVTQAMIGATADLVVVSPEDPAHPRQPSSFHLAWRIPVNRGPMGWIVYVDAQDGSIVKRDAQFQE